MPMKSHVEALVIGIGNTDRGDDGAGIAVARHLRAVLPSPVPVVEQSREGTELIALWRTTNAFIVYVIDAMSSGLPPGTVRQYAAHHAPLPAQFGKNYSTHSFGLADAVELARVLACLPEQLIVYGIEGECFDPGMPLSPEVRKAVEQVAHQVAACLVPV